MKLHGLTRRLTPAMLTVALVYGSTTGLAAAQEKTVRFLTSDVHPGLVGALEAAKSDYEAANPDVHIEIEIYATAARLQKIGAELNARTMPDLIKMLPEERLTWIRGGFLEPLDDVLEELGGESAFMDGIVTPVDGSVYDIPTLVANYGLIWYRNDWMNEAGIAAPTTWEELVDAAKRLHRVGPNGNVERYGIAFSAAVVRLASVTFAQFMWSAGGTFFDAELNPTFDTQATVDALTLIAELAKYAPPGITSYTANEVNDAYATGQVAMAINSPNTLIKAMESAPAVFEATEVVPVPAGIAGAVSFIGANSYGVPSAAAGAKSVDEAKSFLSYLLQSEHYRNYLTARGGSDNPVTNEIIGDDSYWEELAAFKAKPHIKDMIRYPDAYLTFDTDAGASISDGTVSSEGNIPNPYVAPMIARNIPAEAVQRVLLQGASPEDAARWGQQQLEEMIRDLQ